MDPSFWIGLGAIGVGLLLYLIEVVNPGFFIAVPGTVVFGLGVLTLVYPPLVAGPWAFVTIPILAVAATWGTLTLYRKWAPPSNAPDTLGMDNIVGTTGRLVRGISPSRPGTVRIRGQEWRATSDWPLEKGAKVVVTAIEGLTLTVSPLDEE